MISKISLVLGGIALLARAQSPDDEHVRTRQLWDTTLLEKRPSATKTPSAKRPSAGSLKGSLVGITVWRLRPGKAGEASGQRALIQEEDSGQEWMPERVAAGSPLAEGQKVRVSAEAGQDGYLYIIDRDEYADGTKGVPYLIFPTLRTRGGDNHVGPGMVIEIPAQDDNPPYFKVARSRPDQVNEVLTLLITPKPMDELKIERSRIKLTEAQVAGWEKQWKAKSYKLEDVAHEGKPYTVTEKLAARGEKRLTDKDPLPQTMYRVDCPPDSPVMLEVQLKIAK